MGKKKSTFWKDFKAFISRGNVVDMAVGVVVASAFSKIITTFTNAFISPLVAMITGGAELSELKYVVREAVIDPVTEEITKAEVAITYGAFIQAIIDFLIIAFVLFIVIRVFAKASAKAKELRISVEEAEAAKLAEEKAKKEAEEAQKAEEAARLAAEKEVADAKAREVETVELLRKIAASLSNK